MICVRLHAFLHKTCLLNKNCRAFFLHDVEYCIAVFFLDMSSKVMLLSCDVNLRNKGIIMDICAKHPKVIRYCSNFPQMTLPVYFIIYNSPHLCNHPYDHLFSVSFLIHPSVQSASLSPNHSSIFLCVILGFRWLDF